jgi:small subunit ribosomal protein S6
MSGVVKYEIMIVLNEEFTDNELKVWSFNFAKGLQLLNASEISVISRGKRDFAYLIANCKNGNFIQINFLSLPKSITDFCNLLKFDPNVVRYLVIRK